MSDEVYAPEFLMAVAKMRSDQKEYFRTRSASALAAAKKSEAKVDKMLQDYDPRVPRLFD